MRVDNSIFRDIIGFVVRMNICIIVLVGTCSITYQVIRVLAWFVELPLK